VDFRGRKGWKLISLDYIYVDIGICCRIWIGWRKSSGDMMMTTLFLTVQACSIFPPTVSRLITCHVGQIELYTHHPFLPTLVQNLSRLGIRTCAVYLIESQFMEDRYKFFRCVAITNPLLYLNNINQPRASGVLSAMSAMVNLEIPWINVMSKMDLVTPNGEDSSGRARNGIRGRREIAR
jgi:hypothetical protein